MKPYHIQEAWHSFIEANVDGAGSNKEPFGQKKGMKIHQRAITYEICCLAAQYSTDNENCLDVFIFSLRSMLTQKNNSLPSFKVCLNI